MIERYDEQLLLDYVEGELDTRAAQKVEALLNEDAQLRDLLAGMKQDRDAIREVSDPRPPEWVMDEVDRHIERAMLVEQSDEEVEAGQVQQKYILRRIMFGSGVAAMVALLAGVVIWSLWGLNPYGFDYAKDKNTGNDEPLIAKGGDDNAGNNNVTSRDTPSDKVDKNGGVDNAVDTNTGITRNTNGLTDKTGKDLVKDTGSEMKQNGENNSSKDQTTIADSDNNIVKPDGVTQDNTVADKPQMNTTPGDTNQPTIKDGPSVAAKPGGKEVIPQTTPGKVAQGAAALLDSLNGDVQFNTKMVLVIETRDIEKVNVMMNQLNEQWTSEVGKNAHPDSESGSLPVLPKLSVVALGDGQAAGLDKEENVKKDTKETPDEHSEDGKPSGEIKLKGYLLSLDADRIDTLVKLVDESSQTGVRVMVGGKEIRGGALEEMLNKLKRQRASGDAPWPGLVPDYGGVLKGVTPKAKFKPLKLNLPLVIKQKKMTEKSMSSDTKEAENEATDNDTIEDNKDQGSDKKTENTEGAQPEVKE